MREADLAVRLLYADVQAAAARHGEEWVERNTGLLGAWSRWKEEWDRWYRENEGYGSRLWGNTVNQLRSHVRRYNAFHARFGAIEVESSLPSQERKASKASLLWPLAIGTVAVFGIAWLVRETRIAAEAVRGDGWSRPRRMPQKRALIWPEPAPKKGRGS